MTMEDTPPPPPAQDTGTSPETKPKQIERKFPKPAKRYANRPIGMSMFREEIDMGTQPIPEAMLREGAGGRIDSVITRSSDTVAVEVPTTTPPPQATRSQRPQVQTEPLPRRTERMSMSVGENVPPHHSDSVFAEEQQQHSCMDPIVVPVTYFFNRVANLVVNSKTNIELQQQQQQQQQQSYTPNPAALQRKNAIRCRRRRPRCPARPAPTLARRRAVVRRSPITGPLVPGAKFVVLGHVAGGLADEYYFPNGGRHWQSESSQRPVSRVHRWGEREGKWYLAPRPSGVASSCSSYDDDEVWCAPKVPEPVARPLSIASDESLDCRIPEVVPAVRRFEFEDSSGDEGGQGGDGTRRFSLESVEESLHEDRESGDGVEAAFSRLNPEARRRVLSEIRCSHYENGWGAAVCMALQAAAAKSREEAENIIREAGQDSLAPELSGRGVTVSEMLDIMQRHLDGDRDLPEEPSYPFESSQGRAAEEQRPKTADSEDNCDELVNRSNILMNLDMPAPLHFRRYQGSGTDDTASCSSYVRYDPYNDSSILLPSQSHHKNGHHTQPILTFYQKDQAYLAAAATQWDDEDEEPIDQSLFAGFDAVFEDTIRNDSYFDSFSTVDKETDLSDYPDSDSDATEINLDMFSAWEEAPADDNFYRYFVFADVILRQPKARHPTQQDARSKWKTTSQICKGLFDTSAPPLCDTEALEADFRLRPTISGPPEYLTEVAEHRARNLAWEQYRISESQDDEEWVMGKDELTTAEGLRRRFLRMNDEESNPRSEENFLRFYRLRTGRLFFQRKW